MKFITSILVLSFMAVQGLAQSSTHQVVQDEAWALQSKEPSYEERLREENTRWMLKTSARHWSKKGDMTPEDLDKLRSIYRNKDGKQKVDAFSIITFVEDVEYWEGDLIQMLYSNQQAYVQSGLNVLSAKLQKGNVIEKSVLGNNAAIASRINDLESLWVENANIQSKVKQSKFALDKFRASNHSKESEGEIPAVPPAPELAESVAEMPQPEPAIKEPVEVATVEAPKESAEQSTNWLLWLIGALVILGGLAVMIRRKS